MNAFFAKILAGIKKLFVIGKDYAAAHPEEVTKIKDTIEEVVKKNL